MTQVDKSADIPIGNTRVRSMNPKKFGLWLFMISVVMIFASLTSAYVVKKATGNWSLIEFPSLFNVTSVLIVLSSLSIHFSYLSAKKNNLLNIRIGLVVTGLLAISFTIGQYLSWGQLVDQQVFFVGNASGSFIYVFTGLHVAHLFGGLIFLAVVLYNSFKYRVHSKSLAQIEMCVTYWHFLGGLWLYLYLFLVLNN
ncbi:MAG: cytochrome c oxidase subunit 3 [Cyclobacteriaceae bacterium]